MRKVYIANVGRALALVAVVTVLVGVAVAQDPAGKFQVFGATRLVVGGVPPDNRALDLTSNCGAQPYSATCYSNAPFVYSGVDFAPKPTHLPTLASITTLSTDYNVGGSNCEGGAPRYVIFTAASNNYTAYFGQPPYGPPCYFGWQNTGNFTSTTDSTPRWQVNLANTFNTWAQIVAGHGSELVTEIAIVVDGGWSAPQGQDVAIDNFTVNKRVMEAGDAF